MGKASNRLISAARSAWYGVYEPRRLAFERHAHKDRPWEWHYLYNDPLVSVVIPTHNRFNLLLDRALPSVRRQKYSNFEIIVAAHGCTDGTNSIATEGIGPVVDSRVRVIRVPRRRRYPPTAENHWLVGPVDPINAALAAARGAWIARIDDDDEWTPDHIDRLLRFAQAGNYEFVSSAYVTDERVVGAERGIGGVQTWLYRSYLRFMRANIDSWRKSWDRVNDTDLAERFRRAGVRIGYLDAVTAVIRPRPGEQHVGSKAYLADPAKTEASYRFS